MQDDATKTIFFSSTGHEKFRFLSHMFAGQLEIEGRIFGSAEQAFECLKLEQYGRRTEKLQQHKQETRSQKRPSPLTEKELEDWNGSTAVQVMRIVLRAKFAAADMKGKLLETRGFTLVERIPQFPDSFWGVDSSGHGANVSGQLLMEARDSFA